MTTNPTKIFFELYKILDPTRNDFEVVNSNYENVVIFIWKKLLNRVFSFNFCTLLYSELISITIDDKVCYKIKNTIHSEIPSMFITYQFRRDLRKNGQYENVRTMKHYNFLKY